jgi:transposase-like protein
MVRALSNDLREHVVSAVLSGENCRAVALQFGVAVSSVVKWSQRYRATGSVRPDKGCPAGTVVATTSFNRLAAARPHSAGHVEASDPDIIVRRLATSERTMTPALASRGSLTTTRN